MKKRLTKLLFISLLCSAIIPSNVQTSWFTDAKNTLTASSKLVKNGAKNMWDNKRRYAFATGTVLGITANVAIHEWGHKTMFNYFFPNSAKIGKIRPWGGVTHFKIPKTGIDKRIDRLKFATGLISGPIIGLLGSYSLFRLLKHYNTKNPTHPSFLSGLEFGFSLSGMQNVPNFVSTCPSSDGARAWSILIKNVLPKQDPQWYHYSTSSLINYYLAFYYLKAFSPSFFPDFFLFIRKNFYNFS